MTNAMFQKDWKLIQPREAHDPALNLAVEEYAVRHLNPAYSYVFFYVNRPSVILGRYQNVLQEVNLPQCWRDGLHVLRRISGGGTVAHDLGNLNFTFITQHTLKNFNQYVRFLQPIVKSLTDFGASVTIDQRSNLRIAGQKISGNAQFTSGHCMLSHGTLLFDADLQQMGRLLNVNKERYISSRATKSMRSEVTNVRPYLKREISMNELQQAILFRIFGSNPEHYVFNAREWVEIEKLAQNKYRSFAWNIGHSPPCFARVAVTAAHEMDFSFSYELKDGIFRRFQISDSRFVFFKTLLEKKPLSRQTFDQIRKRIDRLNDAFLKEKAQRIYDKLI